jgi:hypothetical protein
MINDGLNEVLKGYDTAPLVSPRGRYEFSISSDTSDFREPEREGNSVTWYINGLLSQSGSSAEYVDGVKDGENTSFKTITMNTRLEIVVPVIGEDKDGNKQIVEVMRSIFDEYFSQNGTGVLKDEGGVWYAYGFDYNIPQSGIRAQRPMHGDSFTFLFSLDFFFIQGGMNSKNIVMKVRGNIFGMNGVVTSVNATVPYTSIGFRRNTTQEGNLFASSTGKVGNGVQSAVSSSTFTINVACPTLYGDFNDIVNYYLFHGKSDDLTVILTTARGVGFDEQGNSIVQVMEQTYKMCFLEATLNGEQALNASTTAVFTEVM